jgi:hypothetical protein
MINRGYFLCYMTNYHFKCQIMNFTSLICSKLILMKLLSCFREIWEKKSCRECESWCQIVILLTSISMFLSYSYWYQFLFPIWSTMLFLICCSGLQIREALQLQLDVQRRLHEQLEVHPSISYIHHFVTLHNS